MGIEYRPFSLNAAGVGRHLESHRLLDVSSLREGAFMRSRRKSLQFCGLASSTYLFLFTVEGLVIAFVGFSKQINPVNLETKFQAWRSCGFRFAGCSWDDLEV